MITLSVLLILVGFLFCYSTSKRTKTSLSFYWIKQVFKNKKATNLAGLILMFLGLICCIATFGTGSGIFSFIVILMSIASLVILLAPLNYFSIRSLSLLSLVAFIVEFLI